MAADKFRRLPVRGNTLIQHHDFFASTFRLNFSERP